MTNLNKYIQQLNLARQQLLRAAIHVARDELSSWFRLTIAIVNRELHVDPEEDGDPWWRQGEIVAHLMIVINDMVELGVENLDSKKLPENWGEVFDKIRLPVVFSITNDDLDRFARMQWQVEPHDLWEKQRALRDVLEGVTHLFGRAFPYLLGESESGETSALREDCVIFETSRELTHVITHLESDLLSLDNGKELDSDQQ